MVTAPSLARFSCRGLKKAFASPVLDGVALDIGAGETLAVMGASGCGKTTLLKALSLLEMPDAGDAWLDSEQYMRGGVPTVPLPRVRSSVGLVFQDLRLFPNLTVESNVTLAMRKVLKLGAAETKERLDTVAERLSIAGYFTRFPGTLSGGQAQRVALARALVLRPRVLLLDEITSALDPDAAINVIEAIADLRRLPDAASLSVLAVTHVLGFARALADRIAFMSGGAIVETVRSDRLSELTSPAAIGFVERFKRFAL